MTDNIELNEIIENAADAPMTDADVVFVNDDGEVREVEQAA